YGSHILWKTRHQFPFAHYPSVIPTGAERSEAKWRDLASAILRQFAEKRSLDFARDDRATHGRTTVILKGPVLAAAWTTASLTLARGNSVTANSSSRIRPERISPTMRWLVSRG